MEKPSNGAAIDVNQIKKLLLPYQQANTWCSTWQIINSVVPFLGLWVLMVFSLKISYLLTLPLIILAAGFMVRIFIIFHDCGHYSFFKSRRANDIVGVLTGVMTFTPYYRWRHDHAIHHATAGDLDRRGTGDVMTLTVEEFKALPGWKRKIYAFWRHPLILFTIGSFLVFVVFNRFSSRKSGRKEVLGTWFTNLALAGLIAGMISLIGWKAYLLIQVPMMMIAATIGVWLFYVQHNFEGTYWARHAHWNFYTAALKGSSYYQLPRILQWFSGNIGFHHIHHLNAHIPNYRLPGCYRDNPVLQVRPLTLRSSLRSLNLRLWDEASQKMVGFEIFKKKPILG